MVGWTTNHSWVPLRSYWMTWTCQTWLLAGLNCFLPPLWWTLPWPRWPIRRQRAASHSVRWWDWMYHHSNRPGWEGGSSLKERSHDPPLLLHVAWWRHMQLNCEWKGSSTPWHTQETPPPPPRVGLCNKGCWENRGGQSSQSAQLLRSHVTEACPETLCLRCRNIVWFFMFLHGTEKTEQSIKSFSCKKKSSRTSEFCLNNKKNIQCTAVLWTFVVYGWLRFWKVLLVSQIWFSPLTHLQD